MDDEKFYHKPAVLVGVVGVIMLFALATYINVEKVSNSVKELTRITALQGTASLADSFDASALDENVITEEEITEDEYPYEVAEIIDGELELSVPPFEASCEPDEVIPAEASIIGAGAIIASAQINCPTIDRFAPTSKYVGSSITLVIQGTNFSPETIVWFGRNRVPAIVDSTTQLIATIPQSLTNRLGTVPITVSNNGGSIIAGTAFTLTRLPDPTITGIHPESAKVGSSATTIVTLTGTNFINNTYPTYVRLRIDGESTFGSTPAFNISSTANPNTLQFRFVPSSLSSARKIHISVKNFVPSSNQAISRAASAENPSNEIEFNVTP